MSECAKNVLKGNVPLTDAQMSKLETEAQNYPERRFSLGTPNMVQSDEGTEFLNSTFQGKLKRCGIKFYTSKNEDLKVSVIERFNKTLKSKMYRYFTHKNTRRYVDVLDDMLHSYNNTQHRHGTGENGCGERRPGSKASLSTETEIVRVEVGGGRQGANNDAETSVQKRLPGRLVS